jgi:hypothetical protein
MLDLVDEKTQHTQQLCLFFVFSWGLIKKTCKQHKILAGGFSTIVILDLELIFNHFYPLPIAFHPLSKNITIAILWQIDKKFLFKLHWGAGTRTPNFGTKTQRDAISPLPNQ